MTCERNTGNVKVTLQNGWGADGRGKVGNFLTFKGQDKQRGVVLSIACDTAPKGLLVLEISYTDTVVSLEVDVPRTGTIALPGRTMTVAGRIDAPYPGAPSAPGENTVVYFEVNRCSRGGSFGDLRRTIALRDPAGVTQETIAIPRGSKRVNILGSLYDATALPNGSKIEALTEDGTVIADYSGAFFRGGTSQSITYIGFSGVELPPQATSLRFTGNGGASTGYVTCIFHLDP